MGGLVGADCGQVRDGVEPLALELDRMAGVVVLDSSEGGREWPAYVVFRGRDRAGLELAGELAEAIADQAAHVECELRTTWRPGLDPTDPILELTCPAGQVIPLALALRASQRRGARHSPRAAAARRARPHSSTASQPAQRRLTLV